MQVQGDAASAIHYLELAIASDSTNADAYSSLAMIKNDLEMLSRAKSMGFSRGNSESFLRKQQESVSRQKKEAKPL
jgi:Tfp pilus assembly protein PilF